MFKSTREFVEALQQSGELARVGAAVSPVLEIAAIADQMSKTAAPSLPALATRKVDPRFGHLGGKALLFENVEGSDWPVLINQFGSYRRMEMALGCGDDGHAPGGLEALAAKIGSLAKPEPPRSFGEMISKAREFLPLLKIPPRRKRGSGVCQEVVIPSERVDLTRVPIIRCWPMDGDFAALGYPPGVNDGIAGLGSGSEWKAKFRGRYITLAGIHTVHADDRDNPKPASHNIGMYRVQLLGKNRVAMHWHMHHDGARHWRSWKKLGKPMPVAIVLGGESVMAYAATAPLPPGISELLLAGFLNRGGIPMVRGKTVPLWVPANAEIVIEGYVSNEAGLIGWDPREAGAGELGPGAVFEGPFGDHTGFYSLPDRYPIVEVSAITHRREPIYPTTVVGLPPQEDYFMGKATERLFLPLLKTIIHDIEDYDLPMFGVFHSCAMVKIKKEYPLQARRVMHSIWGAGQMAWTKTIVVVDQDVDVHDSAAVMRVVGERCHPGRDVVLVDGPLDILDHAAPYLGAGTKIGFDATRKIAGGAEDVQGPRVGDEAKSLEIDATLREAWRRRIMQADGVIDASCPEMLGGRWVFMKVRLQPEEADRGVIERAVAAVRGIVEGAESGRAPVYGVVVGPDVDVQSVDDVLFHWCAHTDAKRDVYAIGGDLNQQVGGAGGAGVRCAVFDSTPKSLAYRRNGLTARSWPPILKMTGEVEARVRERWGGMGLSSKSGGA